MKAFITGATGFVGSHLADLLLEKGYEVYCLKRKTSSTKWLDGKKIHYVNGDLFSNEVLSSVIKEMDYVFHVAGVVKAKNRQGFITGNQLATKNIVEITFRVNPEIKKFIHISSLAVCGPNPDNKPLTEDYLPRPITTYGVTKLEAEKEVLKFKDKIPVTIIRPPAVYGPRDTEILVYFKTFSKGLNSIIGFQNKYLSLVYVKDLVKGIVLAAESEKSNSEIFFISSDKFYNWNELGKIVSGILKRRVIKIRIPHFVVYSLGYIAQFLASVSGKAATLNVEKCKDITRERWVCSNEKAKKILGFNPEYEAENGFLETIDWYKREKWI
jgi:nucleoside-diphosphate-sugar epimerase